MRVTNLITAVDLHACGCGSATFIEAGAKVWMA
jgi:hypothetical protein